MLSAAPTVRDVLAEARARLSAAGCDTPGLDAELLLAQALGVDRATLLMEAGRPVDAGAGAAFEALVARREAREPVAYLLGRRGFRRLELAVDPRVLVPRPETELLVEAALQLPAGARVLDVATGSGAVALAVKDERPDLAVTGSDVSGDALALARDNARRLGLEVGFVEADLLAPGDWDAVLANLPYVADQEWARLAPEIVRHEPRAALAGGPDGLDLVRRLVAGLGAIPFAALEVGRGQAPAVSELLRAVGFPDVSPRLDLAGIERVVVARRP